MPLGDNYQLSVISRESWKTSALEIQFFPSEVVFSTQPEGWLLEGTESILFLPWFLLWSSSPLHAAIMRGISCHWFAYYGFSEPSLKKKIKTFLC